MSRAISDDDWQFLPLPLALAGPPNGMVQVFSQRWWSVCPQRGLRFYNPKMIRGRRSQKGYGAPQCNANRLAVEYLQACKADDILYIERVFVPINLDDWRD